MVRTPLIDILGRRLPAPLVGRYRGSNYSFWIDTFNSILAEFERLHLGKGFTDRAIVPWQNVALDNPVPAGLASVDRAWTKDGEPIVIEGSSTGFSIDSSFERPTTSSIIAEGAIVGYLDKEDRRWLYGNIDGVAVGQGLTVHASQGTALEYTLKSWVIQAVSAVFVAPTTFAAAAIPGQIGQIPVPEVSYGSTPYVIAWDDYLVVEGTRRLDRVSLVSDLSPLPPEMDDLLAAGLRAYGEVQTDQTSKDSADWIQLWESKKRGFIAEMARQPSFQRGRILRRISMPRRG